MTRVLIIEDDAAAARAMAALVAPTGHEVALAHSLADARQALALGPADLVLLDLHLPDGSGLDLFDDGLLAQAEVILITAHASVETSIAAFKRGVADYLMKPISASQLDAALARFMEPAALRAEFGALSAGWQAEGRFGLLWGRSAAMQQVYEQLARVAPTSVSVMISGESGTGKELAARMVHDMSRRRHGAFLAVNCGAISPRLIESELFGHERGAFTGAERQHIGLFERSDGGTLFLDEITEMPLELQVRLLRVLETGTFMRVGSTQLRQVNVRVVAACNRPPLQAVAEGRLREDLYYRLAVFPMEMPPLRERAADVSLLADLFLDEAGRRYGVRKRWSHAARARIETHRWPGNVRELRNAVERACLMSPGEVITDQWLPADAPSPDTAPSPREGHISLRIGTPIVEAERLLVLGTLRHFKGHREQAAAALGISVKTLYNRLRAYAAANGERPGSFGADDFEAESAPAPF